MKPAQPILRKAIGIALFAFFVLTLTMDRNLNLYDEGIVLVDALRVMNGELLHRDFYSNYGPAQYYVIAALFKLFGIHFIIGRLYAVVLLSAIVALLFCIVSPQVRISISLGATAICAVWMGSFNQYLYPIYPCILLSLAGSHLIFLSREKADGRNLLLAAGACTGLITLFRYETGFFVMIAHLAALAIIVARELPKGMRVRKCNADWIVYCLGIALVFLPVAGAYLAVAPVDGFIADVIDYPRKYYAEMRGLPFPNIEDMLAKPREASVYLPVLAAVLAASDVIRRARTRRTPVADRAAFSLKSSHRHDAMLIIFGMLALALFFKGIVRVSALHMLMGIVPSLIVFACLVEHWFSSHRLARVLATMAAIAVIAPTAHSAVVQMYWIRYNWPETAAGWLLTRHTQNGSPEQRNSGCAALPGLAMALVGEEYLSVARFLQTHTPPGEPVFVGLTAHDRIFVNAVALYFVARREPGTHWHHFDPGLQTRADIQNKMVSELHQRSVKWVVRDGRFTGFYEPNGSAKSSGVKILDDYLDQNYKLVAASGKLSVWLQKSLSLPPASNQPPKCLADRLPND